MKKITNFLKEELNELWEFGKKHLFLSAVIIILFVLALSC
jgi:hypothetical protein